MANCPKCGAPRAEGAAECPQCGVIYARFEEMLAKRREAEAEAARREQIAAMREVEERKAAPPQPEKPKRRGLVFCPVCKKQVSGNAESCPHCGEPIRDNPNLVSAGMDIGRSISCLVILVVAGLIGYAILQGEIATRKMEARDRELQARNDELLWGKKPAPEGDIVIGENTLGCRTVEDFRKLADMAAVHDHEAFSKAMINYIAAGRCNILDPGAKAYREDSSLRHGAVKVRLAGQTESWWINNK